MKKFHLPLLLAALLLLTAGVAFSADTLPKPDKFDEEEILTGERLAKYDHVVVKDFTLDGAELINMDEDEKKLFEEGKKGIVKALTESIVKNLKDKTKFKSVEANKSAKGKTLLLKGKFYQFNGGIGAAKFFLGFMAPKSGKTNIGITAELIEASSGKVLARIKDIRAGGEGSSAASRFIVKVFTIQATDEGEELAEFIGELY
ncbi:DUF4410 domain-containing protein [Geotalea sp. SG265]|uniref:DUF4410 domain-containing protein n=1 Tax=Geotalea sp. SG265 TaxID=2922867 RepID=UPI001FAF81C7|nr:DUF4410 domain-containing protein [Geotalea sp. SG265]